MGKKIGVVNLYYKTYNYGAQLQVYALQKAIAGLGYDAEVIRFRWYMSWLEQFYKQTGESNYDKFEAFAKSVPHSERIYTPENIRECIDDYDIFVCGSDQIWGVGNSMPRYVLPQITLSFVPEHKLKIAYGISMGGAATSDEVKNIVRKPVQELDAVSVREKSAVPFVSSMTVKPVFNVLDPTMLLDASQWDEIAISPNMPREYIFVYNIGENRQLEVASKQLAETHSCEIVSISYSPDDAPGPLEFLGFVKNAKYVLTNSFHGTVFSILYNKDFWVFPSDNFEDEHSKNIRFTDLLDLLGLSERFIRTDKEFRTADCLRSRIDYSAVSDKMRARRSASMGYLEKNLALTKKQSGIKPNAFADIPDPARDYLSSIADGKSGRKLSYEHELIDKEMEIERLSQALHTETTRNEIYCKLLKFQSFGLTLDYDPQLQGKVVIYGAGKVGRLASICFDSALLCFVDNYVENGTFRGYPIYKLNDAELRNLISQHKKVTFLITPVWDFDTLEVEINKLYPDCTVVSIEKTVRDMWLE